MCAFSAPMLTESISSPWIRNVYLCEVADTPYHIQRDIWESKYLLECTNDDIIIITYVLELELHHIRQQFEIGRKGRGATVRAWYFTIAAACPVGSTPSWCRFSEKYVCLHSTLGHYFDGCVIGQETSPSYAYELQCCILPVKLKWHINEQVQWPEGKTILLKLLPLTPNDAEAGTLTDSSVWRRNNRDWNVTPRNLTIFRAMRHYDKLDNF